MTLLGRVGSSVSLAVVALSVLLFPPGGARRCLYVDPPPETPPPGSYFEQFGGALCPLPAGPSAVRWWAAGLLILAALAILIRWRRVGNPAALS